MKPAAHGVPADAVSAWLALADRLSRLEAAGRTVVCQQRPAQWFSDDKTARRDAAEACGYCPARSACGSYADQPGTDQKIGTKHRGDGRSMNNHDEWSRHPDNPVFTRNHGRVPIDSGRLLVVDPVHLDPETVDYLTRPNEHGVALACQFVTRGDPFTFIDVHETATGLVVNVPCTHTIEPHKPKAPPTTPGVSA